MTALTRLSLLLLGLLGCCVTGGCASHSVWGEDKVRVVSSRGEPHLLTLKESSGGCLVRLQLRGGAETKVEDYRVRDCYVSFDSFTEDYPYLFPVTIPLDLVLVLFSSPVAGVEHLLADTSTEVSPVRVLAPGEVADSGLEGPGTVTAGERTIMATFSGSETTAQLPWNVSLYFLSSVIHEAARDEQRLATVRAGLDSSELSFVGRVPLDEALKLWEPIALEHKRYPAGALEAALSGAEVPDSKVLAELRARLESIEDEILAKERARDEREAKQKAAEEKRAAELAAHTCQRCEGSGIAFRIERISHEYRSPVKKDWVETRRRYAVWSTAKERDRGASGAWSLTCAVGVPLPPLNEDYGIDVDHLRFAPEVMSGELSLLYRSFLYPALCRSCRGSGDPLKLGPPLRR